MTGENTTDSSDLSEVNTTGTPRKLVEEPYDMVLRLSGDVHNLRADLENMTRERDAAVKRAEDATPRVVWRERALEAERYLVEARRERDAAVARAEAAKLGFEALSERAEDLRYSRNEWKDRTEKAEQERDWWRAAAEHRGGLLDQPAPAVSREDVKGVIDHWITQGGNHEALLDNLWRWVSGDDPAVYVVRESDIAAVKVERDQDGDWITDGSYRGEADIAADGLRNHEVPMLLRYLAQTEAIVRAIEAEQAVDPVEELAGQIETATRKAVREVIDALSKSVDMQAVEDSILATVKEDSQWLANHVLGQAASSDE